MTGEGDESAEIKQRVIKALKNVYDPEIPVNVYDLGLIYRIDVDERGNVELDMTLTSPGCPVAEMVLKRLNSKVKFKGRIQSLTEVIKIQAGSIAKFVDGRENKYKPFIDKW